MADTEIVAFFNHQGHQVHQALKDNFLVNLVSLVVKLGFALRLVNV